MGDEIRSILVIGATGQQGGSVVRHLLKNKSFKVRALVRYSNSDKAQALLKSGTELVVGDLNDVDSLVVAMKDCYGVFAVTNFWDPSVGYEGEIQHAKNIGDACKRANIKHLVFSTLDRESDVPHFESKVKGEDYIRSLGVPMTSLVTSFYFENFMTFFPPKEVNGELVLSVAQKATTKVPMYACYDTGGWVLQAFLHPESYLNKDLPAVSQYISYPEIAEAITNVTGRKCKFQEIPLDAFRNFGFPGANELADNLQFFNDISEGKKTDRRTDLKTSQTIFTGETFEGFLNRTGFLIQ
jgi:uncharacterized protein YbjT (DUF2867 family)